jgi:hypothetical protein
MNYFLATTFLIVGVALLVWNKPLSEKFGAFYSRRFSIAFGTLARLLAWDDPNKPFNKFMYRGFVITGGILFLVFALAALSGTNFVGPSAQSPDTLLQVQN